MKRHLLIIGVLITLFAVLAVPVAAQNRSHTVEPGDNLQRIANIYGVTVAEIIAANNLTNPNRIIPGQVLVIPGNPPATTTTTSPTANTPTNITTTIYTVQSGDTLREIAAEFGTDFRTLADLNNLTNPNRILPGQVLLVPAPVVVTPVTVVTTPTQPAQPLPPIQPVRRVVNGRYTVQFGDTLSEIARAFGVDMYNIARANGILNLNFVFVGQSLRIPGY